MISQIESALLARLRLANDGRLGYKLAAIESYGGEFDDDLTQVVRCFPGVWVTYGGGGKPKPYGSSKSKWLMPATFVVMVGDRNLRNEASTRQGLEVAGQVREVGTYRLLRDARRILLNQDFGLAIARLEPGAVKTLFNTKLNGQALSVFAQEWHTAFVTEAESIDAIGSNGTPAPDWLRVGINYHLTPDDGRADASDLITLT